MKEIVNQTSRPVTLEDGTILAAAGTEGSVKRVEFLSEADARRLSESVFVRDVGEAAEPGKKPAKAGTQPEQEKTQ